MFAIVQAGLDCWLTAGRFADSFESRFAKFLGLRAARLVNSGSSANLLAVSVLTSPALGARQLKPGDEVITVAAGFPTTVNPIVQNRLVPVFLDVELDTYNVECLSIGAGSEPAHASHHPRAHTGKSSSMWQWWLRLPKNIIYGSSKIAAMRLVPPLQAGMSVLSETWQLSAFTRPTISPWARAAVSRPTMYN